MRVYKNPHRFYCGVDLHARTLFLHMLDHNGQTRFEKNIPARRLLTGPVALPRWGRSRDASAFLREVAKTIRCVG